MNQLNRLLLHLLNRLKARKIRFDLIFIQLMAVTLLLTAFFITIKQVTKEIPQIIFNEIGKVVATKTAESLEQIKLEGQITQSLLTEKKALAKLDGLIQDYLFTLLKVEPFINRIDIVIEEGKTLSAAYLPLSAPPAEETSEKGYSFEAGEAVGDTFKITSQSYGRDFTSLSPPSQREGSDPRNDSWYKQIQHTPSDFLVLEVPSNAKERGLALVFPLQTPNKIFIGAMKFNLSMPSISHYIDSQKAGRAGNVFVMDGKGLLIFPLSKDILPHEATLLQMGYKKMTTTNSQSFIIPQDNDKLYFNFFDLTLSSDVHWYVVTMTSFNKSFNESIAKENKRFLGVIIIAILTIFLTLLLSRYISNPIIKLAVDVEKIRDFDFTEVPSLNSHIQEIKLLENSIKSMRSVIRAFSLYIPKDIVKKFIRQENQIRIGGVKSNLTLFFCDIADFTEKSESLEVESLFSLLSNYFDSLSKTIIQYEGTIDKYIGDSIMAFWGAPNAVEESQKKACFAALRIQNDCHRPENLSLPLPWKTRIGIHFGEVIVGNIGTPERINYTAIGDSVNTCSRLEGINKQYNTSIIISQTVQEAIGKEFLTRPLDYVAVKGKKNRLLIYELVGVFGHEPDLAPTDKQVNLCRLFNEAYEYLINDRKEEAKALFLEIREEFPDDKPTEIYLQRLAGEGL